MSVVEFRGFAGIKLYADIEGSPDDPSVLLLHGGGQTRRMWDQVKAALVSAGRQVISLDMRGHGQSDRAADGRYELDAFVEDLRLVLEQLASRPVVVAASLGGWVATLALTERGVHLASGLVLVDAPPSMPAEATEKFAGRLRRHMERMGDQLDWDARVFDDIDVELALGRVSQAGSKLTAPVLFVRGEKSEISEHGSVERFVSSIANAELAEVEEAGHLVAEERVDLFNGILTDFLERKAPRKASEYKTGSDLRTLRDALGCFATGVTIVTALDPEGRPVGLTANSFTSVSLDPPLVLVCIAKTSGSREVLANARSFVVNVLHIGQQPTSNRFARRDEDRFASTPWEPGISGAPVISGCLAAYECRHESLYEAGDHIILIGQVDRARFEPQRDPLLYFRGKYRRLHFH